MFRQDRERGQQRKLPPGVEKGSVQDARNPFRGIPEKGLRRRLLPEKGNGVKPREDVHEVDTDSSLEVD